MTWRERIALAVAAIAVPVAIVLGVFAVDVLRTPGWISADDARFQNAPIRSGGLWNEPDVLATRARITSLVVADDLAYRRTVFLSSVSNAVRPTRTSIPRRRTSGRSSSST